jgi:hypothetical protein
MYTLDFARRLSYVLLWSSVISALIFVLTSYAVPATGLCSPASRSYQPVHHALPEATLAAGRESYGFNHPAVSQ